MKGKRFSEEQIVAVLKQLEAGVPLRELCRQHGVSEQSIYRWRSRYGGLEVSQLAELKRLEEENRQLKHIVADLTLDKQALKAALSKKY